MDEKVVFNCVVCGKEMPKYNLSPHDRCCDGTDCGCYGKPIDPIIDPPVCSVRCYKSLKEKQNERVKWLRKQLGI